MSVNIFHSNKPQSFNDCYFAESTIKQELSSYANNPLNGCVLLYGAYGTGKSTAVELIARDRGAAKSDIHYVHTNGSQFGEFRKISMLVNAMQWGVINHQTPVLIVDEVDILSKENQLWLSSFIDDWQHRVLILLTHYCFKTLGFKLTVSTPYSLAVMFQFITLVYRRTFSP